MSWHTGTVAPVKKNAPAAGGNQREGENQNPRKEPIMSQSIHAVVERNRCGTSERGSSPLRVENLLYPLGGWSVPAWAEVSRVEHDGDEVTATFSSPVFGDEAFAVTAERIDWATSDGQHNSSAADVVIRHDGETIVFQPRDGAQVRAIAAALLEIAHVWDAAEARSC